MIALSLSGRCEVRGGAAGALGAPLGGRIAAGFERGAQLGALLIGEREIIRREVSHSSSHATLFSSGGSHVGESVSKRHVIESAVMASEIEQVPDLTGILKFASYPGWMRMLLNMYSGCFVWAFQLNTAYQFDSAMIDRLIK